MLLLDDERLHPARSILEKYWIWAGLFYPIHHIHQALHQVISFFFLLYKMFLITKDFLMKIQWKRSWQTSWAQNQLNFTWEESTSYLINGKRWFKIMANILLFEIKSLLNYSWIDYILSKWKLLMTQPNNCRSKSIRYLLNRTWHQKQFTWKTKWPFDFRQNNLKFKSKFMNYNKEIFVEQHFRSNGEDFKRDTKFIVIERTKKQTKKTTTPPLTMSQQ